ncbi:hypothetical protein T439DRAFT_245675 [Meredithblackwellia eburnea MCA 4105]
MMNSALLSSSQRSASPPLYDPSASSSNSSPSSAAVPIPSYPGAPIPDRPDSALARQPSTSGTGPKLVKRSVSTSTQGQGASSEGRADQIVQHFFSKACAVIAQARLTNLEDTTSSNNSPAGSAVASAGPSGIGPVGAPSSVTNSPVPGGRRRSGLGEGGSRKNNRWFNLDLPDTPELFHPHLRPYRSVSASPTLPPPLTFQILLDTSSLSSNQVLVLSDQRGRRIRVASPPASATGTGSASGSGIHHKSLGGERSPRLPPTHNPAVVLERWTIRIDPPPSASSSHPTTSSQSPPPGLSSSPSSHPSSSNQPTSQQTMDLPPVYKHAILHFRTMFTLARTLPAWTLYRRLSKGVLVGGGPNGRNGAGLGIMCKIGEVGEGDVGVDVPIVEKEGERPSEKITFPPVVTPVGSLVVECTYRLNADFAVEAIETLLSSTFIDQDFFRPTMARYQMEAAGARPGSLPIAGAGRLSNTPPSYGSLSSRHQHHQSQSESHSRTLSIAQPQAQAFSASPLPVSVPSASITAATRATDLDASSPSSSGRFGSYSGSVEPAFVSLSRARGQSWANSGGFSRGTPPLSSSPSSAPLRRPSITGSGSSGSPIFRPGSYLSSPPLLSSSSGPTSNINRISTSASSRSPLSSAGTAVATTGSAPRPIVGSSGSAAAGRGTYGSLGSAGAGGFGSYHAHRSSLGGRSASGSYGTGGGDAKRFIEGHEDDSDAINSFLGLIDSRPDLSTAGLGRSGTGSGEGGVGGSKVLSRTMADEQLKRLAASVQGGPIGSGSSSSSTEGVGIGIGLGRTSSLRHQSSRQSIAEEPAAEASSSSSPITGSPGYLGGLHSQGTSHLSPAVPSSSSSPSRLVRRSLLDPPAAVAQTATGQHYFPGSSTSSSPVASTGGLSFPQYIPARQMGPSNIRAGFELGRLQQLQQISVPQTPPTPQQTSTAASASGSIASLVSPSLQVSSTASLSGNEDHSGTSSTQGGYGGEEEAVGRLELTEEDEAGGDDRRARWDVEDDTHEDGTGRLRSRDRTPAAGLGRHGAYFRRDDGRSGGNSPEISWMG